LTLGGATGGRTRGQARRLCARRVPASLAAGALALFTGCQLIAGLRDIEEVDAAVVSAGRDATVSPEAMPNPDDTPDSTTLDATPEVGVPDGPYGSSELDLIDNMESETGIILSVEGRNGPWFTYNDGSSTGQQTPMAGGAFAPSENDPPRLIPESLGGGESHYAAQTSGYGFSVWGAGMGFNFTNPRAAYDASAYTGFVFWGRIGSTVGSADGGVAAIRLNVPDANTDSQGDVCTTCSDYFGVNLTFTTEWKEFTVLFSDLAQVGWGSPYELALDATQVYACQFLITTESADGNAGARFDLWIDDIYFIKNSE
jgi:hypothetical protein